MQLLVSNVTPANQLSAIGMQRPSNHLYRYSTDIIIIIYIYIYIYIYTIDGIYIYIYTLYGVIYLVMYINNYNSKCIVNANCVL